MEATDFAEQREDLVQSIERDEAEVYIAVHELADVARSMLDLRAYIRKSPLTWAIGAFLVGALIGRRTGRPRYGSSL